MGAVNAKTRIMMYQSLSLILVFSTCGAFAQFKCENHTLPDGTYCPEDGQIDHTYADPEHCSRFWDCYNGCMTHMQCQQDYLYDIPHGWCDEPHKVTCGDRDPDDRPCKDCGPGPDPPFFDCEAAGGDGFYAYDKNCRKYIQCSGGLPDLHTCNPGLLYRPSNVQCDYPDRVDCGDRPVCDDNDENCEDHHLTTTTPKPSPCDDIECDHGDDFYPEGTCKPCFCQCHDGVQDEICCQPGLVFNPATNTCDWPYNTNGC